MGVNGIGFGAPAVDMAGPSGGGGNPRLKALEQKLQQLNQEKKKASTFSSMKVWIVDTAKTI